MSSIRSNSAAPQKMANLGNRVFSTQGLNSKPSIEGVDRSIERIFKELDRQSNEGLNHNEFSCVYSRETPKQEQLLEIDG